MYVYTCDVTGGRPRSERSKGLLGLGAGLGVGLGAGLEAGGGTEGAGVRFQGLWKKDHMTSHDDTHVI